MKQEALQGFSRFAPPLLRFATLFSRKPQLSTHRSRLSAPGHVRRYHEEFQQAAQIDPQHRRRESVADLWQAAQLDLVDRCAVLLAITKQRLDQLAHHLIDPIPVVPHRAAVDRFRASRLLVLVSYS
ncbi:MAG: hypothetical protein IT518_24010 [Burkholderiales bacterium]|nr:hypothetical protein [Burkholderiales bacterium]